MMTLSSSHAHYVAPQRVSASGRGARQPLVMALHGYGRMGANRFRHSGGPRAAGGRSSASRRSSFDDWSEWFEANPQLRNDTKNVAAFIKKVRLRIEPHSITEASSPQTTDCACLMSGLTASNGMRRVHHAAPIATLERDELIVGPSDWLTGRCTSPWASTKLVSRAEAIIAPGAASDQLEATAWKPAGKGFLQGMCCPKGTPVCHHVNWPCMALR